MSANPARRPAAAIAVAPIAFVAAGPGDPELITMRAATVLGAADYAAIMVHGRIAKVGRPNELEAELSTAYLGA